MWIGKRVLVTGAGGFIGSHLTETLVAAGADVTAFVHYNALGSAGWLDTSSIRKELKIVRGHIEDPDSVAKAVRGQHTVFHLAALIAIPHSYEASRSYVRTNIDGTLNILLAAKDNDVERVVHTSTSEVYGSARYVPIDEAHPLQGQSPYSATKIGADKIAEAFHLSAEVPVVTVRPFNTYGPRQSARAVIPTIILQALRGDKLSLGATQPTRDFNYVADTVDGFLACALAERATGEVINIGTGREVSVAEVAEMITAMIGNRLAPQLDARRMRPDASEVERLCADNRKAAGLTGWTPSHTLEQGLEKTVEWFRGNEQKYAAGNYVL